MTDLIQAFRAFVENPEPKLAFGLIFASLTYIFSLGNPEMWVLIGLLVVIDTITGVIAAYHKRQKIESQKMFKAFTKIVVYGVVVALANATFRACACIHADCPEGLATALRLAVFGWIVATEGKSINENMSNLGYRLPKLLEEMIQKGFKK